jgi:hypothetical protein
VGDNAVDVKIILLVKCMWLQLAITNAPHSKCEHLQVFRGKSIKNRGTCGWQNPVRMEIPASHRKISDDAQLQTSINRKGFHGIESQT